MKALRKWHRRLGILSFLMVIWLAASGLMINHGDALGLNKAHLNYSWLNGLYGLENSVEVDAALVKQQYFFCQNGKLFKNTEQLSQCESAVKYFSLTENYLLILSEEELFVLSPQGELYESLKFSLLGKSFLSLEVVEEEIFLFDTNGVAWLLDMNSLELIESVFSGVPGKENNLVTLPNKIAQTIGGGGVTAERFLLDLHSGRLFGIGGVLAVDFFAICFLLLSLTGFFFYFKQIKR